jgi:fumarate hydratase class I
MKKAFQEKAFIAAMTECIRQASCELPEDVVQSLECALKIEDASSIASSVLETILQNIKSAKDTSRPICQDTGLPFFYVSYPQSVSTRIIKDCIEEALKQATEAGYLRPNAVDSVTGMNSGNNLGIGIPAIEFEEWDQPKIHVKCMLKGGGCENVSAQYAIPSSELKAGRDLEGVFTCVLDAVLKAQGKGCAPGIIGVGIGGDRISSMQTAKKQLFRELNDKNAESVLAELEHRLYNELNKLEIGPMGLGGKTTVLGVKIGKAHRIPASFFVSISYMCWACRRKEISFLVDIS